MKFGTTSEQHKHRNRKAEMDNSYPGAHQRYVNPGSSSFSPELHLIVEIGPPPASDESPKWRMLADKVLGPADELEPQIKPEIDLDRWMRSA